MSAGDRLSGLTDDDARAITEAAIRDARVAVAAVIAATLVDHGTDEDSALGLAWVMSAPVVASVIGSLMATADRGIVMAQHRQDVTMPALESAPLIRVDGRDIT